MLIFVKCRQKVEQNFAEPKEEVAREKWTWDAAKEFRNTNFFELYSNQTERKWKEMFGLTKR